MQKTLRIKLPKGKCVAVSLGVDLDAQTIWEGLDTFHETIHEVQLQTQT